MSKPASEGPAEFKGWQWLYRGVYCIEHAGHTYHLETDFFDWSERLWLYKDGQLLGYKKTKGRWPLTEGAELYAEMQTFGMRHAYLSTESGTKIMMQPVKGTGEHSRQQFDKKYPLASRAISAFSLILLIVSLLIAIPGWLDIISGFIGFQLWRGPEVPATLTGIFSVTAIFAGIERSLRFKKDSFS